VIWSVSVPKQGPILEQINYRLILVLPNEDKMLARYDGATYRLPTLGISTRTRHAEELQKGIRALWGLSAIVLDILRSPRDLTSCVVAQLLSLDRSDGLIPASLDQLNESELDEQQRVVVEGIIAGDCGERGPFSRVGWIDEAVAWLRSETGKTVCVTEEIQQYNSSGKFALVRFQVRDGSAYWLKATGDSNAHEFEITEVLSQLSSESMPPLIAMRGDWNAWLMKEAGKPLEAQPRLIELERAAVSMAKLQKRSIGMTEELLKRGAIDQRPAVLRQHLFEIFDYLKEVMAMQTSTKVPRVEHQRLCEIGSVLRDACFRMELLNIPDTLNHGDMNCGNILFDGTHCRFIDWSEACIGSPFVTLQHMLLLNPMEQRVRCDNGLKEIYKRCWLGSLDSEQVSIAFALTPLLAAASYLYGRGDWLQSPHRRNADRQIYARSLARHMDRAAQAPELLKALCH
jgi:hypothetical protein